MPEKEGITLQPDQVICQRRTRPAKRNCWVSMAGMCEIGEIMDGRGWSLPGLPDGATREPKLHSPTMTSTSRTSRDCANCNRLESSSPTRCQPRGLFLGHHLVYMNGRFTSLSRHTLVILVSRASLRWPTTLPTWLRRPSRLGVSNNSR